MDGSQPERIAARPRAIGRACRSRVLVGIAATAFLPRAVSDGDVEPPTGVITPGKRLRDRTCARRIAGARGRIPAGGNASGLGATERPSTVVEAPEHHV